MIDVPYAEPVCLPVDHSHRMFREQEAFRAGQPVHTQDHDEC